MARRKLTKKQEKFAEGIAENLPVQTAAKQAGYSNNSANTIAYNLLENTRIRERIEQRKAECARLAQVTKEQIIGATVLRAFATIDDALDENGYLDIEKARETGAIHLIKKISKTNTKFGVNTAVEFYSNESAQDKLANYLGLEKAPLQTNPELETSLQFYKEFLEKGFTSEEAVKKTIEIATEAGVKITEDEILKAELVG